MPTSSRMLYWDAHTHMEYEPGRVSGTAVCGRTGLLVRLIKLLTCTQLLLLALHGRRDPPCTNTPPVLTYRRFVDGIQCYAMQWSWVANRYLLHVSGTTCGQAYVCSVTVCRDIHPRCRLPLCCKLWYWVSFELRAPSLPSEDLQSWHCSQWLTSCCYLLGYLAFRGWSN